MILYLGRRLLGALGILLAICAITFTIFYLLPADPAVAACGKTCSPERVAEVKAAMGLDQPVWEQFATYVTGIFAGRDYGSGAGATHCGFPCLGYSYEYSLPVWGLLTDRLPVSVSLAVGASVLWLVLGLGAGVTSALRKGGAVDRTLMVFSVGAASFNICKLSA